MKDFIKFEIPLKTEKITSTGKVKKTTTFIDALTLETKVLIEQKSSDKDFFNRELSVAAKTRKRSVKRTSRRQYRL
ncbi:MAG: hypothetical protein IKN43_09050 [Selenomonadaceae bacterium]|nr:hypothetical protein [Selenomonadaceae bacterium]